MRTESSPPELPVAVIRRWQLINAGMTPAELARAVRSGELLRPRRGYYLEADTHPQVVEAIRCGGKLDCVALLARLGIFVLDTHGAHVQLDRDASRVPPPSRDTVRHWRPTHAPADATTVPLIEALAQSVRCQGARATVATLDNAWHLRLVEETDIRAVFDLLPRRYRVLLDLLDPRSESGPETLVRLLLRALGCNVELQVLIEGVGRVDLLVDGWLIVECDSRAHHGGWAALANDRRRDLAAAARGYATIRVLAEDVFLRPEWLREQFRRVLRHSVGFHNSGSATEDARATAPASEVCTR